MPITTRQTRSQVKLDNVDTHHKIQSLPLLTTTTTKADDSRKSIRARKRHLSDDEPNEVIDSKSMFRLNSRKPPVVPVAMNSDKIIPDSAPKPKRQNNNRYDEQHSNYVGDRASKSMAPSHTSTNTTDDRDYIHHIVDEVEAEALRGKDLTSLSLVTMTDLPSRPTNEKRAILADIRRKCKEQNYVIFCSDRIRPDLTVGQFCYEYVRENTYKRWKKTKRNSNRKSAQLDDDGDDDDDDPE